MAPTRPRLRSSFAGLFVILVSVVPTSTQTPPSIRHAIVAEPGQKTAEVSTGELERILADNSATVFDARPYREFAISHIPGAVNVSPKANVPMSMYVSDVAEIGRLLGGRKTAPIVLYCNGPQCGKSNRLAAELVDAGFTNVRRYQLGIPVWRAVVGICQIEMEGVQHVVANDQTAVVVDAREASDFKSRALGAGARNIPRSLVLAKKDTGEIKAAKDDGRLPMEDHNTRIIVVGQDAATARYVAEAVAREAFQNVTYFAGSIDAVRAVVNRSPSQPAQTGQRHISRHAGDELVSKGVSEAAMRRHAPWHTGWTLASSAAVLLLAPALLLSQTATAQGPQGAGSTGQAATPPPPPPPLTAVHPPRDGHHGHRAGRPVRRAAHGGCEDGGTGRQPRNAGQGGARQASLLRHAPLRRRERGVRHLPSARPRLRGRANPGRRHLRSGRQAALAFAD